jgi:hypothetical protein
MSWIEHSSLNVLNRECNSFITRNINSLTIGINYRVLDVSTSYNKISLVLKPPATKEFDDDFFDQPFFLDLPSQFSSEQNIKALYELSAYFTPLCVCIKAVKTFQNENVYVILFSCPTMDFNT